MQVEIVAVYRDRKRRKIGSKRIIAAVHDITNTVAIRAAIAPYQSENTINTDLDIREIEEEIT